jgi:hypothetical protein
MKRIEPLLAGLILWVGLTFGAGCGKSKIDQALESDANGYLCRACKTKFYTDRQVFANHCPNCKAPEVMQLVGFVCPDDNQVTISTRGAGFGTCEKCRKPVSGLKIPSEADLKTWGAEKKAKADVGA